MTPPLPDLPTLRWGVTQGAKFRSKSPSAEPANFSIDLDDQGDVRAQPLLAGRHGHGRGFRAHHHVLGVIGLGHRGAAFRNRQDRKSTRLNSSHSQISY